MPDVTRAELNAAADAFFTDLVKVVDQPRDFHPVYRDQEITLNLEHTTAMMEDLRSQLQGNAFGASVEQAAQTIAEQAGSSLAALPTDLQLHALQLAARALLHQGKFLQSALVSPETILAFPTLYPGAASSPRHAPRPAPATSASKPVGLSGAVALYLAARLEEGISQSHHNEMRRALDWMTEALGPTTLVGAVTAENMREVRRGFQHLDVRKRGKALNFVLRQTDDARHWIAPQTSSRYWHTVQAFFAWLRDDQYTAHDPAEGMRPPKRSNRPPATPEPFSDSEVHKLLRTPLFAGRRSKGVLLKPGFYIERGSYWWATMIGLHTGMRAGEISQLEVGDVNVTSDPPVFHIRREGADGTKSKTVKNPSSIRDVPISPVLITLRLADFVKLRAKAAGSKRLFPDMALGVDRRGRRTPLAG